MNMKENKTNCHPELDSRSRCSIKGFTLIELLVVVLIIGVLTAIAVPQYQKAVLKSRFSSLMPTTQAIRDGNEMYYMTNGGYADALAKLDVTTANTEDMNITLSNDDEYAYTMATRPNINNNLIMYQKHSTNFPGEVHCEALKDNSQAEWLCGTALHGTQNLGEVITEGYNTYVLEGTGKGLTPAQLEAAEACNTATAMGLTCSITTNEQGQTVKQVCINGVCRTKTYNEDGSYTSVTCLANSDGVCTGGWISATYDTNGNKLTRECNSEDSSGNCAVYDNNISTYDARGNILTYRYCDSVDSSGKCTAYDGYGEDYTYDARGNMLTYRECDSVDSSGKCTAYSYGEDYTYDANGKMLTERTCDSVDSSGKCTAYGYGQNYTYDARGNMLTYRECDSVDSSGTCTAYGETHNYRYTYDTNGNMLAERNCSSVDSSGKCTAYSSAKYYTYDADGNILTKGECATVNSNGTCRAYSKTYNYTYDANGNMLTQRYCRLVSTSGTSGTSGYSVKCSAYMAEDAYNYTYDANGNMLTKRQCSSVDNSRNCTAYGGFSYDYTYDDDGMQIARQSCSGSNINTSTGECIAYNNIGGTHVYSN